MAESDALPLYLQVKRRLMDRIAAGDLSPGDRAPTERALVEQTGASRMTVNRALRELADEGVITRIQGAGSFVAEPKSASDLLTLHNIADEIAGRRRRHSADVLRLARTRLSADEAARMRLERGAEAFHSILVHREDGTPIQLEDRLVNPASAPDYLTQDFTRRTPNAYLTACAPASAVEHVVEAGGADAQTAERLAIAPGAPCLIAWRRTWTGGAVASLARLTHPADRYRLTAGRPPVGDAAPL
ncbi:MAG: histidine utilization repressor [Marivibrio sp.]|uniref:histidine utilization repressor n=1 Tax=Marivibrio sp. TaxID=2039719 RepID=UPI0032F01C95